MKMTAQHTQGPWRADRSAILATVEGQLVSIAVVFSGAAASLAEANANQLLIAAAPDLLAAAQRVYRETATGYVSIGAMEELSVAITTAGGVA
jgi:hypothetical protein